MQKTHGKKQTRKNKTKRRAIRGGGKIRGFGARGLFGNKAREAARTTFGNRGVYKPSNKDDNKKDNTQSQASKSKAPEPLQQTP